MNRKALLLCLVSTLLSYGIVTHICLGLSHNGFSVYIDPQNSSARVGHTFSVNVSISNVSAPGLWAYEFKLHYDKAYLEPVSAGIPSDHFLKPTVLPQDLFVVDPGTVNQTGGTVSFAAMLVGSEPGKTGSGTLVNVKFVIRTPGRSTLSIGGYTTAIPKFVDGNGNIIPSSNYTITEGYAEGLPLPPPAIPPPPQTPGRETLAFNFKGIYGYLTFPEECHPGDAIAYNMIVAAEPDGIHLNYFRLNITCNATSGQKILHNETIQNQDLPETWVLNETIALAVPGDAYGKVHCILETETYGQFTTCDGSIEIDTTYVRTTTYQELQTAYQELLNQHNATLSELQGWIDEYKELNGTYNQLLNLYNTTIDELHHWQNQYQNLNSTYHDLLSQHNATLAQLNHWIDQYGQLNTTYNQLLKNYDSLNSSYQKIQFDYNSLRSSYDSLQADYRSLNSSYNLLKQNYDSLQSNYNDLLAKYNSLNSTYQQLSLNYTILSLNFEELKQSLTILQSKYDNLSSSYNLLNSTYYALLKDVETLNSRNDALVRELWLNRVLWLTFLGIAIAAVAYTFYSIRKRSK